MVRLGLELWGSPVGGVCATFMPVVHLAFGLRRGSGGTEIRGSLAKQCNTRTGSGHQRQWAGPQTVAQGLGGQNPGSFRLTLMDVGSFARARCREELGLRGKEDDQWWAAQEREECAY